MSFVVAKFFYDGTPTTTKSEDKLLQGVTITTEFIL